MLLSFLDLRRIKFGLLSAIAVGGSLVFGAAAGSVLRHDVGLNTALLLTLSTGCSWVLLCGLLVTITRKPILDLAEVCLIAMGFGEVVLLVGALADVAMPVHNVALPVNFGIVLTSNVVMAIVFARGLQKIGVSLKLSLALWILGLNGSWPIFLFILAKFLTGAK